MHIDNITTAPYPQIRLTHYHLSRQDKPASTRTAYLLCLAADTQDYQRQINTYLAEQGLTGQAQLAPLPIQSWLSRHGFEAKLWRAAQQITTETPLLCLYTEAEAENHGQHFETYLNQQSVHFEPFTEFIVAEVMPREVRTFFFADFEGLGEYHKILNQDEHKRERENQVQRPPHFYAVVDCAKAVSFPSRLKTAGRLENLYTGSLGQALEEQAPYLLEFDPYQQETVAFLQRLFRRGESKVFSHWAINPVIFLKSRKGFDEVYRHLRKWTHLYDPDREKWYFFRFYDPLVLNRYLSELSHYPAQLAALFGVKTPLSEASGAPAKSYEQEQIIEAFGLRVEEEFISFRLNPLADNTLPAKIELGKVEKQAFAYEKWLNTKVKLKSMATEHIDNVDSDIIDKWLEEAKSRNIAQSQREYWFYLIGRLIAENNEWDYFKLLEQWWQKTHYSNTNLLETLMNHLIDIENNNNDS
ncbi:DUF4123 domain-containing protein [Aggregatibacter actinomycetemcomitans]|nr:DUF4123 domain-containing protein [Aggregatibacter actinomycetemcomitans]MBN6061991.1 DUF4123 domain-containing protein [Aggregatibacter actinomycetemcomitans]UEL52525.1 DUF4123 domain-containing protein [Aggregatibacter actinomycetemcomitans]UEL54013.1 DUF4123 domain-containing protein [Aggregatibacter actinomycetemcomitans]